MKSGNLHREALPACYQDRQMSDAESSAVPDLADYEVCSHHLVSLTRVGLRDHRYQRKIRHAIDSRLHRENCQPVVRPSRLSQTTACCLQEWRSWPFPISVSMCKYIVQIKSLCLHQDHRLYRCFHHAHFRLFHACLRCPVRWPWCVVLKVFGTGWLFVQVSQCLTALALQVQVVLACPKWTFPLKFGRSSTFSNYCAGSKLA
jgi:hypothetical protein